MATWTVRFAVSESEIDQESERSAVVLRMQDVAILMLPHSLHVHFTLHKASPAIG
jgi:hypothetical protein